MRPPNGLFDRQTQAATEPSGTGEKLLLVPVALHLGVFPCVRQSPSPVEKTRSPAEYSFRSPGRPSPSPGGPICKQRLRSSLSNVRSRLLRSRFGSSP